MAPFKVCFLCVREPGQIIPVSGVWNKRRAIPQRWGTACHLCLLATYYISCWFSFSLSPGQLINGPAGGIPGRVIWDYIIKSHCQGFPTSCELFTPGKSPLSWPCLHPDGWSPSNGPNLFSRHGPRTDWSTLRMNHNWGLKRTEIECSYL